MNIVMLYETHVGPPPPHPPMRPMRGAADAAARGQGEEVGSLALPPPRVRGLFGLSSAIFDYVVGRKIERSSRPTWYCKFQLTSMT
jgi:hypothetical protein